MTAWLDTLLPPLDPATGFLLLSATLAGFGLACAAAALRRRLAVPEHDPHAREYGDVTERPHG